MKAQTAGAATARALFTVFRSAKSAVREAKEGAVTYAEGFRSEWDAQRTQDLVPEVSHLELVTK